MAVTAGERVPFSKWRTGLVNMVTASNAVPQFWAERDASLDALAAWRRERSPAPSYSDVLIAACGEALLEVPEVNSRFDGDGLIVADHVNVGILMPVEDALVAPGVADVPSLTLEAIASERRRLATAAAAGSLKVADLTSGTFTLSNLGPHGVTRFQAILLPPQSGVIAVGARRPDGTISLVLTVDHRSVDGIGAARFLATVVDRLEQPSWLSHRSTS